MIQTRENLRNYDSTFRSFEDKVFCLQTFLSSAEPTLNERIALYHYTINQLSWVKVYTQNIARDFMRYEASIVHLTDPESYHLRMWIVSHSYLFAENRLMLIQKCFQKIILQLHPQIPQANRVPQYKMHRPTLNLTMREIVQILDGNPPQAARELTGDDLPLSSFASSHSKRNSVS